ncbi:ribosomal protein S8 [Dacryopinax primogenitus]|uniref:Ribosomal protein S8 n=1 Tax=Dacryopinax primogenitus (strain DJM 731) TaxID=1858805 RepID=M5FTE1_DACPD|nr:ribosomal protein S8 [Dacryopinax primogenitus]EJT99323.1 ribosomal protein S8 [Dacryopinax primogenitus]
MLPHVLCSTLSNAFKARHSLVPLRYTAENLAILSLLLRHGFLLSLSRGTKDSTEPTSFLTASEQDRRIWAQLKYRDDISVLGSVELISHPSKRIFCEWDDLYNLTIGRRAKYVRPMMFGEIAVVQTKDGRGRKAWMEIRDAVRAKKGGELLVRAR